MSFAWPFGSSGGKIKDLHPLQLADAGLRSIQHSGRNAHALRLFFRALEIDPYQPHALLVLIDVFRGKKLGARPTGDEIFAGVVVEYALDPEKSKVPHDKKILFEKARLEVMATWGFAKPQGNDADYDHIGYMTFINNLMGQVHSLPNGFLMARAKLGVQCGALDRQKLKPTSEYNNWLNSPQTAHAI